MRADRHALRRLAALAALLQWVLVLMPMLSQAVARPASGGDGWLQVCTAAGTRLVAAADLPDDLQGGPASLRPTGDECVWCRLACPALGASPSPDWLPVLDLQVLRASPPSTPGFHSAAPWRTALARAPPARALMG